MRAFWNSLDAPLAGDLRLYGGTALALYLNHRESTDFDFATPKSVVDPDFAKALPWLAGGEINGGPGMLDVRLPGRDRQLRITLMECGPVIPFPHRRPVMAANGIAVAHPFDLIVAKCRACASRGEMRDYVDIAAAVTAWPDIARQAASSLDHMPAMRLAAALGDPLDGAETVLSPAEATTLRQFAARLVSERRSRKDPEPGKARGPRPRW